MGEGPGRPDSQPVQSIGKALPFAGYPREIAGVSNRLQAILEVKKTEVAKLLPRAELLRAAALQRNDFRPFALALDRGSEGLGLIAEVKKASPSAGVIAEQFDPVEIARSYEAAGAHAISVLTDEPFFQGKLAYLPQVRQAIGLPVLRKDFIIHEVQIHEAVVAGADAILLIVAALEQERLEALFREAEVCQVDALVEVHTAEELERALDIGASLIGINNRNLTTFEVDLRATEEISEEVPDGIVLVSESGLKTQADARRALAAGCDAILVGESLMRTGDVAAQVRELLG
jgi:indole-3-glycerol phosphate synthase